MRAIPVLTPEQSRAWDRAAESAGRPLRVLMESAGRAVAQLVTDRLALAASQGVLVACGPGNNGGDGWVAARALRTAGVPVWATELAPPPDGIAADARMAALEDGVRLVPADGPWPGVGVIIDALLGTGASGDPAGRNDAVAATHGGSRQADRCRWMAPPGSILRLVCSTARCTRRSPSHSAVYVAAILLARDEIGDLVIVEIGLPAPDGSWPVLVHAGWAAKRVVPFHANAYKGTRGRVVIVGGSPAMVGAARLAARGAFGAGAGLVHVVAPESSLSVIRAAEPDVQTMAQEFSGTIDPAVQDLIAHADAVAIGPGLGRDAGRAAFVLAALQHARCAVVDADALTVLKPERDAFAKLAATRPVVCTPHVGEFRDALPRCAAAGGCRSRDRHRGTCRAPRGPGERRHRAAQGCPHGSRIA